MRLPVKKLVTPSGNCAQISAKNFKNTFDRKEIKHIYLQSFPKYEQLPWWIMRFLTVREGIDIIGYYDGEKLCGFTYTVTAGNIIFVLFFAVKSDLRGKGYGSAILQYLKDNNPEKSVLLNVELLDPSANNFEERVQRFGFYKKNGFYDTGYDIEEVGDVFRVLATTPTFDQKEYLQIFKKMSFGFWKPKIMRTSPYAQENCQ